MGARRKPSPDQVALFGDDWADTFIGHLTRVGAIDKAVELTGGECTRKVVDLYRQKRPKFEARVQQAIYSHMWTKDKD